MQRTAVKHKQARKDGADHQALRESGPKYQIKKTKRTIRTRRNENKKAISHRQSTTRVNKKNREEGRTA